jgi:MinD-like ATPase involved in chromosome partitioning or flagellar assembly
VTTNNDTPPIFGPGAHDDNLFAREWPDGAADPAISDAANHDGDAGNYDGDAGNHDGANGFAVAGGADGVIEAEQLEPYEPLMPLSPNPFSSAYPLSSHDDQPFPAANGWSGWGERTEHAESAGRGESVDRAEPAASQGYPQPSYHPSESEYPHAPAYVPVPRDQPVPGNQHPAPGQPGYPAGPGYALDAGYARQLGYPQDPGYGSDPDYGKDLGYEADLGYGTDLGYANGGDYPGEAGYPPDAEPLPPMEPLPDLAVREPAPEVREAPGAALWQEARPWPDSARAGVMPPLDTPRSSRPIEPSAPAAPLVPVAPLAPQVPAPAEARGGIWEDVLAPLSPPAPEPESVRETSDSLTTESLLHGKRAAPGSGWRRGVFRASGGLLRFGESAAEMRRRDLIHRVRTPVAGGHHRVAVLSLKGGVGKTTTAVGLGATLATLRGDRVIAVDANPDRGTLSDKVRLETAATIRDLLNERGQVSRYADVRAFTSQAPSRLEVLASDRDPGVSVAFGADDYCDAARVLEHFYSICITDCGTGLLHSAMSGVLRLADQIVLVSSPSVDGARSASATLDWLEAHNCGDLVRNGVVVLSAIRPKSKSTVDLDRLEHHFAARCRAVARIPYDPHLEEGAEVELELLGGDTADAYLALAAVVGDGLAWPRRLHSVRALP